MLRTWLASHSRDLPDTVMTVRDNQGKRWTRIPGSDAFTDVSRRHVCTASQLRARTDLVEVPA